VAGELAPRYTRPVPETSVRCWTCAVRYLTGRAPPAGGRLRGHRPGPGDRPPRGRRPSGRLTQLACCCSARCTACGRTRYSSGHSCRRPGSPAWPWNGPRTWPHDRCFPGRPDADRPLVYLGQGRPDHRRAPGRDEPITSRMKLAQCQLPADPCLVRLRSKLHRSLHRINSMARIPMYLKRYLG